LCGVKGGGREAAERGGEGFRSERRDVVQFPALDGFGEQRGASDGSGAAAAEEADFADGIVFDNCGELEYVSADWIADFDPCVGGGEITGVAGMLEMVEESFGEHHENYGSGGAERTNPAGTA
jgi:hypothetical protein